MFLVKIKMKFKCKSKSTNGGGANNSNTSSRQIDTLDKITVQLFKIVLIIDILSLTLIPRLIELFSKLLN